MFRLKKSITFTGIFLALCLMVTLAVTADAPLSNDAGRQADKLKQQGNFAEAFDLYKKLLLDPNTNPAEVGRYLQPVNECLQRLNRVKELDALREAAIELHKDNWRFLQAAAASFFYDQDYGYMISGEFERGPHRGGGKVVNTAQRDRVRALQLMQQAMPLVIKANEGGTISNDAGRFFMDFARYWLNNRGFNESWRLQYLTDLTELPDYDDGWGYYQAQASGAPVDEDGNPVFYTAPRKYDEAENDGQRWRWCLNQAVEMNAGLRDEVAMHWAGFLQQQFGVQTMAQYGWAFGRMAQDDSKDLTESKFALHTLAETETIARLASGVKRFELPDEFNYIKVYQSVADGSGDENRRRTAMDQLARIFENRRQYPKAADYYRQILELTSVKINVNLKKSYQSRLDQIIDNWGRFESAQVFPAGKKPTVDFRFRNGDGVSLTAQKIDVPKLLEDVKAYLKTNPQRDNNFYNHVNIGNIGWRLISKNEQKYIGDTVAKWKETLTPRESHFDKRVTFDIPITDSGAYLVKSVMADGNTSYIVIWISDLAIVQKPLDNKTMIFVADAVSGSPLPKANVEMFGYWMEYNYRNRTSNVHIKQFAEYSDADGLLMLGQDRLPNNYQWLIIGRTEDGKFGFTGFSGSWIGHHYDREYNATKVFSITDRPVYRPEQKVHYKFWVRHAQYDKDDGSQFAGRTFTLWIHNPRGEKMVDKQVKADAYGGFEGSLDLAEDAMLGVYRMNVREGNRTLGSGNFRVEEYKKPEFEVTVDAPTEPIMLGEKIEATIKAKYYFGSPVTTAKVKYKVTRTMHDSRWYPIAPWDWFYGPGYWWFGYDYTWYPGWQNWGCRAPIRSWWPHGRHTPPEVVAERECEIGEDGTVKVEIDTALAKAIHGDTDHSYSITAEVVDESRRTIVGSGNVLVGRKPFSVYAWTDRGYYRSGETILASFKAQTLDNKPVEGTGKFQILETSVVDGKVKEKKLVSWDLPTGPEGTAERRFRINQPGQYRIAYTVTDKKGHEIEGGYVIVIRGEGLEGKPVKFNAIELTPQKQQYAPGEKVSLQINVDKKNGTVLLFPKATNGTYLPPRVLRLKGKSTVEEIDIVKRDMPNCFIEAVTVADGRVHREVREIAVPPEKRILDLELQPTKEAYRPGEPAKVRLRLTDDQGKPFVGSTVVTIYDKSVEYISGGSNVADIREFFWKWRRHHNPNGQNNLSRVFGNMVPPNMPGMGNLGVFGASVADDMELAQQGGQIQARRGAVALEGGFGGGGAMPMAANGMALGAAAAPMDAMADGAAIAPGAMMAKRGRETQSTSVDRQATDKSGSAGGEAPMVEPTVRSNFADTALWAGVLETDKDGFVEVKLDMPENLTTWRIKAWAMGGGTRVGEAQTDVVTRKDLIIRLQAPRFFVQTDQITLSANVHNYLKSAKQVQVGLELAGDTLKLVDSSTAMRTVTIEPEGEARVDWLVEVLDEGEATITMKALTDEESDAMKVELPCYIHGMLKMDAVSGVIRPDMKSDSFEITIPAERRPAQSRLEVRYSPTLAGAMIEALPYLVDYPHGCTEQTLNRFLPTVITQKVLIDMGIDLEAVKNKRTNLNAQEIGDPAERAAQWKRYKRNPVFDQAEVTKMVKDGVERLIAMQCSDGGWGWFSGRGEHSGPHTTATVVHGLQIAQKNDVAIPPTVLERGIAWLLRYQDEQVRKLENALVKPEPKKPWKTQADNVDSLVYMVLVDAGKVNPKMREFLYRDRVKLSVYGLSMLGIALETEGNQAEKLAMVVRNIGQYVEQDDENQTAWLNLGGSSWWYWYGSEWETHAYFLKLLVRTDAKGDLASRLVKYLLNNRKHATYWNSTRDTALCVEAFAEYMRASGEAKPEMTVKVLYDGELKKAVEITPETLFTFDGTFVMEGKDLTPGKHSVQLQRMGEGPLYFNGYTTNFTLENFITRAGLEVKVNRKYFKIVEVEKTEPVAGSRGQVVMQKVEKTERIPIDENTVLKSGDIVEVELTIDSKNDYEYLIFEDYKPSGFETVEVRSGYNGNEMGAYVEFRDERVDFFVRRLARGTHSVSYQLRAEIPGRVSALPARGHAMYAPELKGNSDEMKLKVVD